MELTKEIYDKYPKVWEKFKENIKKIKMHNHEIGVFGKYAIIIAGYIPNEDEYNLSDLPFNMLYALLEDFFEENGITIEIVKHATSKIIIKEFNCTLSFIENGKYSGKKIVAFWLINKNEAKYQAVLKACEILEATC